MATFDNFRKSKFFSFDFTQKNQKLTAINLLALFGLFTFFCVNHFSTSVGLSLLSILFFIALIFSMLAFGNIFRHFIERFSHIKSSLSFDILGGFFICNTLLFFTSLVSPYGIILNTSFIFFVAIIIFLFNKNKNIDNDTTPKQLSDAIASTASILISVVAATIWCRQAQTVIHSDELTIFQVWRDTFIHVREISAFAQSFGASTLQDIKLAGSPAQLYHFASYITPAAISAITETPAIDLYTSFQLPMGIFLTGIAAFCLASVFWGPWPGVAATLAIVVLPDAYQQGFQNRYLSYHFISQVNLGMLYGLACVSLAWIFMILGCRNKKLGLIVLSYLFLVICAFYKAHIFVANALLMIVYPKLYFNAIRGRFRILIGVILLSIFFAVIWLTQNHPRIPVIRFDFSGAPYYINRLFTDFDPGFLKSFFESKFSKNGSKPVMATYGAIMIATGTLGWWLILMPAACWANRKSITQSTLIFPWLIGINYIFMSLGLAVDTKHVGTIDELLNRPLVWAYFGVILWTAGALYFKIFGDGVPKTKIIKAFCVGIILISFLALGRNAQDLQLFPVRGFTDFSKLGGVNNCMMNAINYINKNSQKTEIIQDSINDPEFVFTALAERQLFAGEGTFGGVAAQQKERLAKLDALLQLKAANEIEAFMHQEKINWYLLHPETQVAWPTAFISRSAFNCEGYRVYKF